MSNAHTDNSCPVTTTVQRPNPITQSGPDTKTPFGLKAMWLHFANEMELRRLAKLHLRIRRKELAMAELVGERQRILNRCIRRMRRASGKS